MTGVAVGLWAALNAILKAVDPGDSRQLKDAIAAVYDVIAACPPQILQDYKEFTEESLTKNQSQRLERILGRDIKVEESQDEIETIRDAARLLRALEVLALEGAQYLESDRDEDLEREWVTSDGKNYVIPRITPLAPIDGKPFLRRALLHHRVIPIAIGSFRVRLHRSRLALGQAQANHERTGGTRNYGAALFPGLTAKLSPPEIAGFTVEDLTGFDAEARIDEHLAKARAEECGTIVWAELTMPEPSVEQVQERIREGALDDQPDFRYLVAGSWHRDVGGMRNAASILGGDGELLFEVFKWAKFDINGRIEAIAPGDEVHVLICEDELVTVAVCRDFLDEDSDVPYRKLNVDVAIVPSMIPTIRDEQTLQGHAATANVMRNRFGTRTLVVAQPAVPDKRFVGKVMQFPAKPLVTDPVSVTGPWHLCPLGS